MLASRPHYCINKSVIKSGAIDEGCEDLLKDDFGCAYQKAAHRVRAEAPVVHDIEDLVKTGRRTKGCPYFGSRLLAEDAELVGWFCAGCSCTRKHWNRIIASVRFTKIWWLG